MSRLTFLTMAIHLMAGVTLSGIFVIVALLTEHTTFWWVLGAGVAGLVVAAPFSWFVARRILAQAPDRHPGA